MAGSIGLSRAVAEMDHIRVCLVSWAPFIGGAEVAAERLAIGLRNSGHDVLLVAGTNGPALERFRHAGIRCRYVPQQFTSKLRWFRYRRSRNALIEILREERPHIVHSNDLPTHQMASDAAPRLQIPRICHHRWLFGGPAIDWLNKYGAEHHLFVSQALMDELTGASEILKRASGSVVYDGLPLSAAVTDEVRRDARIEMKLPAEKVIVIIAGQVIERKGHADLIQAWSRLSPQTASRAELLVVGDDLENHGEYREQMEELAKSFGVPARFVGFQKNVERWLAASDIAVVPSHVEPLGNATLEAMSMGLPVIGGHVGGIPEMVVAGKTGLLVPPRAPDELAAALERLILDAPFRQSLGLAGRQRCEEKFSLDVHVKAVLREYAALLSRKPPENGPFRLGLHSNGERSRR